MLARNLATCCALTLPPSGWRPRPRPSLDHPCAQAEGSGGSWFLVAEGRADGGHAPVTSIDRAPARSRARVTRSNAGAVVLARAGAVLHRSRAARFGSPRVFLVLAEAAELLEQLAVTRRARGGREAVHAFFGVGVRPGEAELARLHDVVDAISRWLLVRGASHGEHQRTGARDRRKADEGTGHRATVPRPPARFNRKRCGRVESAGPAHPLHGFRAASGECSTWAA